MSLWEFSWNFCDFWSIFRAFKQFLDFSGIVFALNINTKKNKTYPTGPSLMLRPKSAPTQPPGPPKPIWAQRHGHGVQGRETRTAPPPAFLGGCAVHDKSFALFSHAAEPPTCPSSPAPHLTPPLHSAAAGATNRRPPLELAHGSTRERSRGRLEVCDAELHVCRSFLSPPQHRSTTFAVKPSSPAKHTADDHLAVSPPPRWARPWVALGLLHPLHRSPEPKATRSAGVLTGHGRRPPLSIWLKVEEEEALLAYRSLGDPIILCLVLCLRSFTLETLDLLDPYKQVQTESFCRSNPDFRSIHEHCFLCLGFLVC
jgi:hypothetical protein